MYEIKVERIFKEDYKRTMHKHPQLKREFQVAIEELAQNGCVPESYNPHPLTNTNGNYNGHIDFHLSDGLIDVLVLYMPHKTNPIVRLVRMGSHDELFHGKRF
jgi:mRNA interferase YafQ